MSRRTKNLRGVGIAALAIAAVLGLFAGTALGAPTNTSAPVISPSTPKVGKPATATTGSWNSGYVAHWLEGESTPLEEGKSVGVNATGGSITFAGTSSGATGSFTCETAVKNTSLENPSGGGAGKGNLELEYKNCVGSAGLWGGCSITPPAPVALKIELGTFEGKAKAVISPVEGTSFGNFFMSGYCAGAGNNKPVGVINAVYSNSSSQIEFNPETTATGLRWGSRFGPYFTATGTIGLKTTGGQAVKADSMTYAYTWKRCSATCENIAGAGGATYTPVAADQGKNLKVAVTATDPSGNATVESSATSSATASLSWYVSEGGTWLRPASTSFTATEFAPTVIRYTWGGVLYEISCSGGSGSGTLANTETQANVEGFNLTLTGCHLTLPVSCNIKGEKLVFNTLKASSPAESSSELKHGLTFVPQSGSVLVEFAYTGCGIEGSHYFSGYFPAQFSNEGSRLVTSYSEVIGSGGMRLQGITGPPVGMTSASTVLSEGSKAVKLDIQS